LDLTFATGLFLADDFSLHAQLEDAAVELDRVFDALEVLVDVLHALDLSHICSNTLRVFTDGRDLLLQPKLLRLNPSLDNGG